MEMLHFRHAGSPVEFNKDSEMQTKSDAGI